MNKNSYIPDPDELDDTELQQEILTNYLTEKQSNVRLSDELDYFNND